MSFHDHQATFKVACKLPNSQWSRISIDVPLKVASKLPVSCLSAIGRKSSVVAYFFAS